MRRCGATSSNQGNADAEPQSPLTWALLWFKGIATLGRCTIAVSPILPALFGIAQDAAKTSLDRISEILRLADGQALSDAQTAEIMCETVAIERAAIDIFTVFETRMQRHFKRGPLSRKVKVALLAAGQADLGDRLHQHYLAINVLKHGKGASHRELLSNKSNLFVVAHATDEAENLNGAIVGLIDVTTPHFLDGLTATVLEAYQFLENRSSSSS
jgi:hypothetical protein